MSTDPGMPAATEEPGMRVLEWASLDAAARAAALERPSLGARNTVLAQATEVIAAVRREGDAALRRFTEAFDGARIESFEVSPAERLAARYALSSAQMQALGRAIANVERFHSAQLPAPVALETMPGVWCGRVSRPIANVGLYVPAGSAPLPSTVIMLAVPARLAGCTQRVLCTPPRSDGTAHPAVIVAAELCGVTRIFKIGGAQAIAAMAYGTASVPRVSKIFGPGNAWVTAAKQLVAADPAGAAADMPAGPSEVLVIADELADPAFVAADLIAQAEHGPDSQAMLVTTSAGLAHHVIARVRAQLATLPRREIASASLAASRCIVVPDLPTALAVSNAYAPEHLILAVCEPRRWLGEVQDAGSVFLGPWTPETVGDYCSGTNHVLPTYGHARAYGGLSVLDFLKGMTVQELSSSGLREIGPIAIELARLEGLEGHAAAVELRLRAGGE
jgi:histidinol dehydrogenase